MPAPKIVAAIQARLGSSRLPKKVLLPILGRPMLERIAERLHHSARITEVILATTDDSGDDELVSAAEAIGIRASRGPVDDIAERLHRAACETGADVLVRIWGDCPCVDPAVIDEAIGLLEREGLDFVTTSIMGAADNADGILRTFPYGLDIEVYRRNLVDWLITATDPYYRECTQDYLRDHGKRFRTGAIRSEEDCSDVYVTVDYREDYETVCALFERLYDPDRAFGFRDIVALLHEHPELDHRRGDLARNIEYVAMKTAR